MIQPVARRRTGGRSARVRQAVLAATLQAVAERGADAVSIPEIARQADVHETSIYRRWPSKEHLILDTLLGYSREHLPIPDTGTLRGDLLVLAELVIRYLETTIGRAISKAMAVSEDDPALASARAQFWQSRLDLARAIVDHAIARGEVARDTDPALALELLIAPLHFRMLLTRQPVDEELVERLVDTLLHGLAR